MSDNSDGSFEVSLRVLGNEFIGLQIKVDDMKQKWIVLGVLTIIALGYVVSTFGPTIATIVSGA
jgi:hypothetical protein